MIAAPLLALALVLQAEPPAPCPPAPPCPACPPCAPAAAPPPRNWTGSIGLGLVSVTGNARSVTASLAAAAEYKAASYILSGKLWGTYGESRVSNTGEMQTSAENAGLFLRGDYRISPRFSAYLLAGVETDHPKSIEVRYSQEAGAGYAWIDSAAGDQKVFLRSDVGFRVSEEFRFQYFPTSGRVDPRDYYMYAPRAAVAFRWELNKLVLFTEDLEVLPNLTDGRVLVNNLSKLSTKLFGSLAFGVGFTVNYDSAPAEGKVPWDTTLAATLDYLL